MFCPVCVCVCVCVSVCVCARVRKSADLSGTQIGVVEEYKYLGCVVNEHLQGMRMVEERAKAGAKALGDWLRRCRATVGEVKGATFVRLMESLVESVLLYGWRYGGVEGRSDQ